MDMQFHFYDDTHPLKPYLYALPGDLPEGAEIPDYAIRIAPKERAGFWPILNASGDNWDYAEDHRQKKDERDRIIEGTGTPYWLPEDAHDATARYTTELGPLPTNSTLSPNPKSDSEIKQDRIREIESLLSVIDTKTMRAVRATMAGHGSEEDTRIIKELEDQAQALRTELSALVGA